MNNQHTLVIIKPESEHTISQDQLYKKFSTILHKRGMNISQQVIRILDTTDAQNHYIGKEKHPVYSKVIEYMTSGESIILEIEGVDVVKRIRSISLALRKIYKSQEPGKIYNSIHASDSILEAQRERKVHFSDRD